MGWDPPEERHLPRGPNRPFSWQFEALAAMVGGLTMIEAKVIFWCDLTSWVLRGWRFVRAEGVGQCVVSRRV
jgi:hypothetical protein